MRRRDMLGRTAFSVIALALGASPRLAKSDIPVGPETLIERARALAEQPHQGDELSLPPPFDSLDYDQYRAIRPRAGEAAGLPTLTLQGFK